MKSFSVGLTMPYTNTVYKEACQFSGLCGLKDASHSSRKQYNYRLLQILLYVKNY